MLYPNQGQLDLVIGARNYIKNNINSDLNLDLLSQKSFLSKYHLLRLFKRYYGQTPRQYIIEERIRKAKECLLNGMTVTETCFAIGFESPTSFSTLFKSRVGSSPMAFRKEQLSRGIFNADK